MAPVGELVVRDATPLDAASIVHVRVATWQSAYAHVFPPESLATMSSDEAVLRGTSRWRDAIARSTPRTHTVVADAEGAVVGFASFGPARDETEGIGELYAIYVLPGMQGRGVGQALMAEALRRLRTDGFSEVVLWVLEDNPRTRRFYELAGWQHDGGVKDEEWLGTLVREVRYRTQLAAVS